MLVVDGGTRVEVDAPRVRVDPRRAALHEACPGPLGEGREVEGAVGFRQVSRDETGQHGVVRMLPGGADQRDVGARQASRPQGLEHEEMRLPAAEEDEPHRR